MKRNVRETSIEAFHYIPVRELQRREQEVMDMMSDGVARTQEQMSIRLGWPINRVTGRVNSLEAKKMLFKVGEAKNASGRMAALYQIPQPVQIPLFQ